MSVLPNAVPHAHVAFAPELRFPPKWDVAAALQQLASDTDFRERRAGGAGAQLAGELAVSPSDVERAVLGRLLVGALFGRPGAAQGGAAAAAPRASFEAR